MKFRKVYGGLDVRFRERSVESMKITNPKPSASNGRSNFHIMIGETRGDRATKESMKPAGLGLLTSVATRYRPTAMRFNQYSTISSCPYKTTDPYPGEE